MSTRLQGTKAYRGSPHTVQDLIGASVEGNRRLLWVERVPGTDNQIRITLRGGVRDTNNARVEQELTFNPADTDIVEAAVEAAQYNLQLKEPVQLRDFSTALGNRVSAVAAAAPSPDAAPPVGASPGMLDLLFAQPAIGEAAPLTYTAQPVTSQTGRVLTGITGQNQVAGTEQLTPPRFLPDNSPRFGLTGNTDILGNQQDPNTFAVTGRYSVLGSNPGEAYRAIRSPSPSNDFGYGVAEVGPIISYPVSSVRPYSAPARLGESSAEEYADRLGFEVFGNRALSAPNPIFRGGAAEVSPISSVRADSAPARLGASPEDYADRLGLDVFGGYRPSSAPGLLPSRPPGPRPPTAPLAWYEGPYGILPATDPRPDFAKIPQFRQAKTVAQVARENLLGPNVLQEVSKRIYYPPDSPNRLTPAPRNPTQQGKYNALDLKGFRAPNPKRPTINARATRLY